MFKRSMIIILALVLSLSAVGMAAAQDPGTDQATERSGNGQIIAAAVIRVSIDQLGMTFREFLLTSVPGESMSDTILSAGGDIEAISAAAEANLQERADNALANERINQEQYDQFVTEVPNAIADVLASPMPSFEFDSDRSMIGLEAALIDATADALGVDRIEIIRALRNGQSLNDFIVENGGDPNAVTATASATISTRITEAVADGRLSQERADEWLANIDTNINEAMATTEFNNRDLRQDRREDRQRRFAGGFLEALADELGITVQDLINARREGLSLVDVIEANGGSVESITSELSATLTERINTAVAEGRITEERADEWLENIDARIADFLERQTMPPSAE